jgi:hypothetical protein
MMMRSVRRRRRRRRRREGHLLSRHGYDRWVEGITETPKTPHWYR